MSLCTSDYKEVWMFMNLTRNSLTLFLLLTQYGTPDLVISLDCDEVRLKYRLEKRKDTSEREDDKEEDVVARRLEAFREQTLPVVTHYNAKDGLLRRVRYHPIIFLNSIAFI